MITVGGFLANSIRRVWPPRMPTSSSLTILTTCWAGLRAPLTSAPSARSRTAEVNWRTTGRATSASSRAIRMSRIVALTSDSDRRPLPRRLLKVTVRRSERLVNTVQGYLPRDSTPSHASMSMDTTCATRAGGRLRPPNSVT